MAGPIRRIRRGVWTCSPASGLLKQKAAARAGQAFVPDREAITAGLVEAIGDGTVTNRADVAAWLAGIGEITRQGPRHISVRPQGAKRAIRLKGAIYDSDFNAGGWLAGRRAGPAPERGTGCDPGEGDAGFSPAAGEARARFRKAVERRAGFNLRRYGERTSRPWPRE